MIEYIIPSNIDDRVLARVCRMLENGALAALPTDTSWSIVCSLKSPAGIKKLKNISMARDERNFTLLCSNISQFGEFCSIDNTRFRLIKRLTPGPYVFILNTLHGTEKILESRRREAGVRIPDYPVPVKIIETMQHPLFSVTAKKSMCKNDMSWQNEPDINNGGHAAFLPAEMPALDEDELFENGYELEDIEGLDIILDPGEERERIFSTILDLTKDEIDVLRKGAGPWPV